MSVQENKATQRRYFDEINKGNVEFAEEYLPPDAVYHGPMGDWSREQFVEFHNGMFKAFPDLKITLEEQIAEGDKVVARWTVHATHEGELLGVAPTHKRVTITGIIISRFDNGRDVEAWEELNMLGLMHQLGVIPPPQPSDA
jgi:predicted ester cyclase